MKMGAGEGENIQESRRSITAEVCRKNQGYPMERVLRTDEDWQGGQSTGKLSIIYANRSGLHFES